MYRHEQQRHLSPRPHVLAERIGRPNSEQHTFLMLAFMLASATVALWLTYLPILTGSVVTSRNMAPQHVADYLVDRLHKADRLDTATFAQRWNGVATRVTYGDLGASYR